MKHSPRIVHVLNSANLGGGAKQVGALVRGLTDLRPALIAFEDGPLAESMRADGLPVRIVELGGRRIQPHRWRALLDAVRGLEPDLLHCHGTRAAFNVALLGRKLGGIPRLYTERGLADQPHAMRRRKLWGRWVEAFNGRSFARCVCVSQADLVWARSRGLFPRERSLCIPNAIAASEHRLSRDRARAVLQVEPGAELILTIGRVEPEKAPADVVAMMQQVHRVRPKATLLWIGGGRRLDATRRLAQERGLAHVFRLAGELPDAGRYIPACDVFILASLWEGLPNVLLEALACERACVGTAVNGIPELIVPERTGLLVPPREPAAMAAAVLRLLADPHLAARLGQSGGVHVRAGFGLEPMLARYRALYAELLAGTT